MQPLLQAPSKPAEELPSAAYDDDDFDDDHDDDDMSNFLITSQLELVSCYTTR